MFSSGFLPFLKFQLKLCNLSYSIPYAWNANSHQVTLPLKGGIRRFYHAQLVLHISYLVLMGGHLCKNYLRGDTTNLAKQLAGVVFLCIYATCAVCRVTLLLHEKDGCILINNFVNFERNFIKSAT